jgi:lysophospholipase L1-like esterase
MVGNACPPISTSSGAIPHERQEAIREKRIMKHILTIIISAFLVACGGASGSTQSQQLSTETVLAYGDSTMYGLGGSTPPTATINQNLKAAGFSDAVENLAVSGTQLHELLAGRDGRNPPLAQSLQGKSAARYTLENFGINEALRLLDLEVYKSSVRQFIQTVRSAGKTPVIVTPNPIFVPNEAVMTLFAQIVQAARNVANEEGVPIIDVTAQFQDATRADLVDEVHPNSQFYKRIADFETAELIKVIRQRP